MNTPAGGEKLRDLILVPGLRFRDFVENAAAELPPKHKHHADVWDFYRLDFDSSMWAWVKDRTDAVYPLL